MKQQTSMKNKNNIIKKKIEIKEELLKATTKLTSSNKERDSVQSLFNDEEENSNEPPSSKRIEEELIELQIKFEEEKSLVDALNLKLELFEHKKKSKQDIIINDSKLYKEKINNMIENEKELLKQINELDEKTIKSQEVLSSLLNNENDMVNKINSITIENEDLFEKIVQLKKEMEQQEQDFAEEISNIIPPPPPMPPQQTEDNEEITLSNDQGSLIDFLLNARNLLKKEIRKRMMIKMMKIYPKWRGIEY